MTTELLALSLYSCLPYCCNTLGKYISKVFSGEKNLMDFMNPVRAFHFSHLWYRLQQEYELERIFKSNAYH
jgi:hypothetical protein